MTVEELTELIKAWNPSEEDIRKFNELAGKIWNYEPEPIPDELLNFRYTI